MFDFIPGANVVWVTAHLITLDNHRLNYLHPSHEMSLDHKHQLTVSSRFFDLKLHQQSTFEQIVVHFERNDVLQVVFGV